MRAFAFAMAVTWTAASTAQAQDAMRYYTFQARDAVVTCGQGHISGRPSRTIYQRGRGWVE